MLKVKEDFTQPSPSRGSRWFIATGGLLIAAAVATLRIQAADEPKNPPDHPPPSSVQVESRVTKDEPNASETKTARPNISIGYIMVHPAAMYSFSELRRVFAEGNAGLKQNVRDFGLNEIEDVHLESIVEVIGQLNYQFDPNKEKHRNSISLGLESLRVAESVNIEKWFERTVPGTEIKRGEHATTYLLPEKITRMVLNQIMPTPDRATLVEIPSKRILGTGITADVAAEYASGKKQWESPFAKCGTWRDTCLVGVVVDQNLQKIVERIPDDEPSAAAKPILRCIEHGTAFIGLECARPDDRLKMVRAEVRLTAINDELAETLETQLSTLLSLGRSLLQPPEQTKENAAPSDSIEMQRAVLALLQAAKIKRTGKEIVIQAATQVELDRIVPRVETAAKPANLK